MNTAYEGTNKTTHIFYFYKSTIEKMWVIGAWVLQNPTEEV